MKFFTRDKREVEIEISFGPDIEDTYVESAWFVSDEGGDCTDLECEQLTEDYAEYLSEQFHEYKVAEAENYYDYLMDR